MKVQIDRYGIEQRDKYGRFNLPDKQKEYPQYPYAPNGVFEMNCCVKINQHTNFENLIKLLNSIGNNVENSKESDNNTDKSCLNNKLTGVILLGFHNMLPAFKDRLYDTFKDEIEKIKQKTDLDIFFCYGERFQKKRNWKAIEMRLKSGPVNLSPYLSEFHKANEFSFKLLQKREKLTREQIAKSVFSSVSFRPRPNVNI